MSRNLSFTTEKESVTRQVVEEQQQNLLELKAWLILVWVIGGKGVPDPMEGFEDVSESSSLHGFSS